MTSALKNLSHATLLAFAATTVLTATAADGPYNEAVDAKAEIRAALTAAAATAKPVLVVFGANWCGDCKMLDLAMKEGASAALIARDYRVVKVDVGRFDRNLDVAATYGVPLKQGIPALAVLSPTGAVLYATQAGELANARKMGEPGVHEFFQRVVQSVKLKS